MLSIRRHRATFTQHLRTDEPLLISEIHSDVVTRVGFKDGFFDCFADTVDLIGVHPITQQNGLRNGQAFVIVARLPDKFVVFTLRILRESRKVSFKCFRWCMNLEEIHVQVRWVVSFTVRSSMPPIRLSSTSAISAGDTRSPPTFSVYMMPEYNVKTL